MNFTAREFWIIFVFVFIAVEFVAMLIPGAPTLSNTLKRATIDNPELPLVYLVGSALLYLHIWPHK